MRTQRDQDPSRNPEIWQSACRWLKENQQLTEHQFRQWLDPIDFVGAEPTQETKNSDSNDLVIELAAANDFSAGWVRDHFQLKIEKALAQVTGKRCSLKLTLKAGTRNSVLTEEPLDSPSQRDETQFSDQPSLRPHVSAAPAPGLHPLASRPGSARTMGSTSANTISTPLRINNVVNTPDPRFSFEGFVVGASNQFAYASAISICEKPGSQYNPLFIYSAPGLGKTHMLHAIGNQIKAKNRNARLAYISAESFVNELIESLRQQRMPEFRTKYRDSYDVLLFDDIQFIAGKKQTEEEFFHTFNYLYGAKRQIVLTSDRPPKEIEKLEERIRTRFEWGLVADIQPPEIETRIAILKAKAERDDIYLPDDVATFLATYVKSNIRELEGILIRLQAQSSLTGAEISLEMAKHELKLSVPEENSQLTVENIQATVCKYFQIKLMDLKSTSRAKKYSDPRQIAMYLIRKYTGLGYKEIGAYFGGRDHTTVLHACEKIRKAHELGTPLGETVEGIQNQL